MTPAPPVVLAAGGVLWDQTPDGLRVALVHRPRYDDWSLPKGKVDPGEHLLETAVREIAEETGQAVRLGRPLGASTYLAEGLPKRVHYWCAEALGGTFSPDDEVDGLAWYPVEVARELVHRDSDRAVLDEFVRLPHRTSPVLVLRHGKALARKSWEPADTLRPLSDEGRRQAARVVGLLAAYGETRVISSPALRCLQTVQPYLDATGATLLSDPVLSEEGFGAEPARSAELFAELLDKGAPTLVCSHRPLLPSLAEVARRRGKVAVDLERSPLRTAECLVLHVTDGRVVASERHRAP